MHIYQKKKTQCITKKLKKGKIKNPSPWDDSVLHKSIPIGPLQYDQIFFCYSISGSKKKESKNKREEKKGLKNKKEEKKELNDTAN